MVGRCGPCFLDIQGAFNRLTEATKHVGISETNGLDHSPLQIFTDLYTSHKVGVAPLDAMQAFKKGASFFSEPRRICFNSCFVSCLLFDHVTSHVDGVLSGFEKIIKESPWVNWRWNPSGCIICFRGVGIQSYMPTDQDIFVKSEWSKHLLLHLTDTGENTCGYGILIMCFGRWSS